MNTYTTHTDNEEHAGLVKLLLYVLLIVIPLLSLLVVHNLWQSAVPSYAPISRQELELPARVRSI